MDETSQVSHDPQVTRDTPLAQSQTLEKPGTIKILQWFYLFWVFILILFLLKSRWPSPDTSLYFYSISFFWSL